MKLLIVAMSDSIHTARWLSQIRGQGWDIHIFPSWDSGYVHPEITDVTVYHSVYYPLHTSDRSVRIRGLPLPSYPFSLLMRRAIERYFPKLRTLQLRNVIKKLQPDIVHSLEIQHAGYLTLEAKKMLSGRFPPWIVTNWGSDIYLFGRLAAHKERIKEVLSLADYYSCECQRDVCLAQGFGFSGTVLPVFPNAGGFDLLYIEKLCEQGLTSSRKVIMLKGYQTWAGRALVALRAIERSAEMLQGYTIAIYSATPDVEIAAELFQHTTGVPVVIIPKETAHKDMLIWHGKARISIGVSISDAISTSMLEAMVMGAFPIQSWTACADEWIEDGINGMLVPPEDPEIIEKALRQSLSDDGLVNAASEFNRKMAASRLDRQVLCRMAIDFYETVGKAKEN